MYQPKKRHRRKGEKNMALTRNFLKSMGLTDEQVSAIIENHSETVTGLKQERDQDKEDADKLPEIQKELNALKKEKAASDDWKSKYEKEHTDFEGYKSNITKEKETETKKALYRDLLKASNIDEKRFDAILKVTNFDELTLSKDGKLNDEKQITESIKKDYEGFVVTTATKGGKVETPPEPSGQIKGVGENAEYIRSRGRLFHERLYGTTETKQSVKGE